VLLEPPQQFRQPLVPGRRFPHRHLAKRLSWLDSHGLQRRTLRSSSRSEPDPDPAAADARSIDSTSNPRLKRARAQRRSAALRTASVASVADLIRLR
jgi:hypothetical protein